MSKMMYKTTEIPKYKVLEQNGAMETRLYAPRIGAQVRVSGDRRTAASRGFRILAGYIFGKNTRAAKVAMTAPVGQVAVMSSDSPSQKIAMTAPVATQEMDGEWVVEFTMPSEYDMNSLPTAQDQSIRFVEHPARRQVALTFSGLTTKTVLARKVAELRALAAERSLALGEGPIYQFYDAPWTLPWNRRNEVAFDLK